MKKRWAGAIMAGLLLAGCGSEEAAENTTAGSTEDSNSGMVTYESEMGAVEVPEEPKRIVALTNAPNVLSLDGEIVGVDEWTKANPLFEEQLSDVTTVTETDVEAILELEPDLIIAGSHMQNLDQLGEIAPTVAYTWGQLDYLTQQEEIGKLIGKEQEAQEWTADFEERAASIGEQIKEKIGPDATVSVIENGDKEMYVFGNNYARGTEILYQAMGLNMPEQVEELALESGIHVFSTETLPEMAGDYIVLSRNADADNAFMETSVWKEIPAVKEGRVIEIDTKASTYSDPITLDTLLDTFEAGFLNES